MFGCSLNFVVTVNEAFLHQLQKVRTCVESFVFSLVVDCTHTHTQGSVNVELHRAVGMKYKTLAAGSVRCRELITGGGEKVHGKLALTGELRVRERGIEEMVPAQLPPGVETLQECVSVGSLEYWMRLKLPVTQSIRLYQVS